MSTETKTRGQVVAADVSALLRARNPLLWIVTREEARVEQLLIEAAAAAGYMPRTWDTAQGIMDISGKQPSDLADSSLARNICGKPSEAMPATPSERKLRRDMPSQ